MVRKRHIICQLMSLMLLAILAPVTCPAIASDNAPAAATVVPAAFGGTWFVSAVFPTAARTGSAGDPHLGTLVVVRADEVSDVNGRRCASPHFERKQVKAEAASLGFAGAADQLQIDCTGQPFATLLMVPGKALPAASRPGGTALLPGNAPVMFIRRAEALYLVERGDQALYRQATIAATTAAAAGSMEPASAAPMAVIAEKTETRPKAMVQAQPKSTTKSAPVKATTSKTAATKAVPMKALAEARSPAKTKSQAKAGARPKLLAETPMPQQKAKTQGQQASAASTKPAPQTAKPTAPAKPVIVAAAKNKPAAPITAKPIVPKMALLQSDVIGAAQPQAKTQGTVATETASAKPAAVAEPAVQQAAIKATKTAPKPGMAIQLASYSGIGAATAGWQSLYSAYPELTPLKPLYVAADNTPIVHLYATGAATDKLRQICGDLQSKQAFCTISQ